MIRLAKLLGYFGLEVLAKESQVSFVRMLLELWMVGSAKAAAPLMKLFFLRNVVLAFSGLHLLLKY